MVLRPPQVLLFGNGLVRAFGGLSWGNLLSLISVKHRRENIAVMPETLQATLVTNDNLNECLRERHKEWYGTCGPEEQRIFFREILATGFTEILTTNYGYELEIAATEKPSISEYAVKRLMSHTNDRDCKRAEGQYLLHTFNVVSYQNVENRIWHIHGEARKHSSILLDHYTYGSYLHKIKELSDKRRNYYAWGQAKGKTPKLLSWVDSFIMGDVYVLGFGYGFSEIDLWWLLKRKKREKAEEHGKVYFYEPKSEENCDKHSLLNVLKAEVRTLGVEKPKDAGDDFYLAFYRRALDDIKKEVRRKQA